MEVEDCLAAGARAERLAAGAAPGRVPASPDVARAARRRVRARHDQRRAWHTLWSDVRRRALWRSLLERVWRATPNGTRDARSEFRRRLSLYDDLDRDYFELRSGGPSRLNELRSGADVSLSH
eukprot:5855440-Prymnesium_polylepis.1